MGVDDVADAYQQEDEDFFENALEADCKKALYIQAYTYTTIKNILEKGMYTVPEAEAEAKPTPQHESLRTGEWM